MIGARKVTSILTGFAFLLQTLLLPLASSAQSEDPSGAGGFIRPLRALGPSSNQTTQTSKNFLVRVCVPPDLVKNEHWGHPYPGSEMDVFKNLLRDYILAHGDRRVQYRIKDNAFDIFKHARRASAPYTPDPRNLLEEVSAQQACPPTNYTSTLEVGPDDNSPNPPAQPPPVQDSVPPPVQGSVPPYRLTPKDAVQKCDQLADNAYDPQKVGPGVPFDQINIREALPACQQAATRQPPQARYQFLYGRVLEAANRLADAVKEYSLAEQAGYPMAASNLAGLYDEGRGVPQDLRKAASLFRKAADKGVSGAYMGLGYHYEMGRGVPQDWAEAAKLYQKAADTGNADGYAAIANHYGNSNPPNYAEAVKWSQKAAQGGSGWGSMQLGWHYLYGAGINKDPLLAKRYYEVAAKQGFPNAMYRLGLIYRTGEGVPPDPETAAQWLYQAAKRAHPLAQAELANMFYNGQGTKKDDQAAFGWYLQAAQAGIVRAQNSVAALYELGQGVTKNDTEAVAWYRKAAGQNDAYAMYQLGLHLRRGNGVAWSEAEAMQWFKKAADKGMADAEYAVGYGYKEGLGQNVGQGRQDYRQAAEWLTRAVQHGNDAALIELAWLYYKGWGVERDPQRAKSLYRQASNSRYPNVASMAKLMLQEDDRSEVAQTGQPRTSGPPDKTPEWVPWVVIGGGIAALAYLLSGPSSPHSASAPRSSTDASSDYSAGSYPSTDTTPWSSPSPSPEPPPSRQVRDSGSFMTQHGIDVVQPTHGGASTHRGR